MGASGRGCGGEAGPASGASGGAPCGENPGAVRQATSSGGMMASMRRKCARSLTGVADVEESAPGGSPSVTWEQLLGYAELDLDEKGEASWEKSQAAAKKKWRRAKERGLSVSFPVERVKAALVDYYGNRVGGAEQMRGISKIFAEHGVTTDALFVGQDYHPELRLVYEYITRAAAKVTRARAIDTGFAAQLAQERLVTEEGCELNQRAVELSLKAAVKEVYGDGEEKSSDARRKAIVYNLPGLTVNMIMSPGEIAAKKLDGKQLASEVIDV